MLAGLYAKWMYAWETALTTRDENRIERPLEWGFDHLAEVCGTEAGARVARGEATPAEAMADLNRRLVAQPEQMFGYTTPTDFRLEQRHPELFPTNVRPETLDQAAEYKRRAQAGELRRAPFLRFTSAGPHPVPGERPGQRPLVRSSSPGRPPPVSGHDRPPPVERRRLQPQRPVRHLPALGRLQPAPVQALPRHPPPGRTRTLRLRRQLQHRPDDPGCQAGSRGHPLLHRLARSGRATPRSASSAPASEAATPT